MPARLRVILLSAAVALAFADSSIVVLGLPEILERFDAEIEGIAWVVTAYNLTVAGLALALADQVRRIGAARLAGAGLVGFLAGSIGCAVAGSLGMLIGFRVLQGAGAALLLAAALPALAAATGSLRRGVSAWALASTVGVAVGPAAGGILTELFDWHAIFAAQAPVAVAALLALRGLPAPPPSPPPAGPTRALDRLRANAALACVSAGLVGVLFLAVVLLVDVWRRTPLAAALVVTVLPVAALAAPRLLRGAGELLSTLGGATLLAAGLVALAFAPGESIGWAIPALALAGLGFGATVPALTERALLHPRDIGGAGATTVAARHIGLVVGLLVVTPLLAHDVGRGQERATLLGVALVLDADLPASTKVPLALDLHRILRNAPDGRVPDFSPAFARRAAADGDSPTLAALEESFTEATTAPIARSFRRSLVAVALLALLAAAPAFRLRRKWVSA
jgi:MFS family permease